MSNKVDIDQLVKKYERHLIKNNVNKRFFEQKKVFSKKEKSKKLRIPSIFLRITAGPFQGYDAEYRSRIRQGEFLQVVINATGYYATIPIQNIIFVMEDGKLLRYQYTKNGLGIVEVGKDSAGEIINIEEKDHTPVDMVYFADDVDIVEYVQDTFSDVEERKRKRSSSSVTEESMELGEDDKEQMETDYKIAYNHLQHVQRDFIPLKSHPVAKLLHQLFSVLGFDIDNVTINHHTDILENALKNSVFEKVAFNTDLYKTFVIAYIFIHVNNLGIGYPVVIPGCANKPNDDPRFIICASIKSQFIKPSNPDKFDINNQIKALLKILNTKIIPATTYTGNLEKRFYRMKIQTSKPLIERKYKLLRFPIFNIHQAELKVKDLIIKKVQEKLQRKMDEKTVSILTDFVNNFDNYIKGPLFAKLNYNPDLLESKILIPFIKEYKERVQFEENKFYKKPMMTTIRNSIPRSDDLQEIKQTIINDINSKIKERLKDKNLEENKQKALKVILDRHKDFIKMSFNDIKELKLSLTADDEQKEIITSILMYREMYFKLLENFKSKLMFNESEKVKETLKLNKLVRSMENLRTSKKQRK